MANELQPIANDLVRALGVLAVAQERHSDSDEIAGLTERAVHLKQALELGTYSR